MYPKSEKTDSKTVLPRLEHPTIVSISEKVRQTPSQVLLRWTTQRGISVIPRSTNLERTSLNLTSTAFDLEESDMKSISDLDVGLRFNDPMQVKIHLPSKLKRTNSLCSSWANSLSIIEHWPCSVTNHGQCDTLQITGRERSRCVVNSESSGVLDRSEHYVGDLCVKRINSVFFRVEASLSVIRRRQGLFYRNLSS